MATVAKAPAGTEIYTEGQRFVFEDGTRQVSEAEAEKLRRYAANGGPITINFEEQKPKPKGKGQ